MRIPRWMVPWRKHTDQNTVTPITSRYTLSSPLGWIYESFGGAWQRGLVMDGTDSLLAFSAVFACVSLISGDIAKLRIKVLRRQASGIWTEDEGSAFAPVLRKPNRYQTRLQFIQHWMVCKLIWGNTYILKQRDKRKMVEAMYILDPQRIQALVAPDGDVYYRINADPLAGVDQVTVPALEIIHDRAECLFHPLVGVSPLYAAGVAATQGMRIQANSRRFFENLSRPGGHLTSPGTITDEVAKRLKDTFESTFSGANIGKLLVSGDGLKFEPFAMPADQAQLIEQLKWTGEDAARAFLVPPYKIGLGSMPTLNQVDALNQEYYGQVLQRNIEAIEDLLDEGLGLPADLSVEFDLEQLIRMDAKTQAETIDVKVKSGVLAPNEARKTQNLPPVPGGQYPYLQQQNYNLEALSKRDASDDPFGTKKTPAPAAPSAEAAKEEARAFLERIRKGLEACQHS